jgi:hypothetical protein
LNLYEVVCCNAEPKDEAGAPERPDPRFLVRAHMPEAAATLAEEGLSMRSGGEIRGWSRLICLLAVDMGTDPRPRVVRGPYEEHAHCHGWVTWERTAPGEEWVETTRTADGQLTPRAVQAAKNAEAGLRRRLGRQVQAWIERGPKLYCDRCGQRNDIDNMFFCIACASGFCWQCIDRMRRTPGKPDLVCCCGEPLESIDYWIANSESENK